MPQPPFPLRLAFSAAIAMACAACGPPPESTHPKKHRAHAPPPVAEVRARTIVELSVADPLAGFVAAEVPEAVAKALRRPDSAESRLAEWVDSLRSAEVLSRASNEAGSTLAPDDVRVERSGSRFEVSVLGSNGDAATARCLALLRSAQTWETLRRTSAVEGWIRSERQRVLAELAKLEESQRSTPPDGGEDSAKTPDEERARVQARQLLLAQSPPSGTEMLAALARSIDRARKRAVELRAMGMGEQHPEVRGADAFTRALETFVTKQRDAEVDADKVVLTHIDPKDPKEAKLPPALRLRRARLAAQVSSLEARFAEGVAPSRAPLTVRLLVSEQREVIAARAAAAETLGEGHPRRALLDAELAIVARKIDAERQLALAAAKAELAEAEPSKTAPKPAPVADPRVDQARLLRDRLVRLVVQLEAIEGRLGVPEVEVRSALPCGAH